MCEIAGTLFCDFPIFDKNDLSKLYHLALVSARIMLVTKARESAAMSFENRDKCDPLLLACLILKPSETRHA